MEVEKPLSSGEKYTILWKSYGTLLSAKNITEKEIAVCAEIADFEKKESIIEFLEDLLDTIPSYIEILRGRSELQASGQKKCEDCRYCSWDDLPEVDEVNGKVYCTNLDITGNFAKMLVAKDGCSYFEEL